MRRRNMLMIGRVQLLKIEVRFDDELWLLPVDCSDKVDTK